MANYVLDKAYKVPAEAGIGSALAVVAGEGEADCRLPDAANAEGVIGITTHAQPRAGRYIGVRRLGVASVYTAGPIARGARVCVGDAQGRVAACALPRFDMGSVPGNNALVVEWKDRASFNPAVLIEVHDPGQAGALGWTWQPGKLRITAAHDGDDITTTAAQLKTLIEETPALAAVLAVSHGGASNGSGLVATDTFIVANLPATRNPIGIAEEDALEEGDLIDVLLIP